MEEPSKTLGHQHRKKTAIKIGAGSPIGAALLLGGALATAAFVSTFIRKRAWGSGKEKGRRHQNENPPQESGNQDELDGTKKGEDFVVLDKSSSAEKHHPRNGETKMIEPEDGTDSFKRVVKKVRFEINGGREVIPEVLENGYVGDSPVIIDEEVIHSQGEKVRENTVPEGITKLPLIENDESNVIMTGTKDFGTKYEPEPNERKPEAMIVDYTIAVGDQASSLETENNSAEDKNEVIIEKTEDGVAEIGKEHLSEGQKQEADAVPLSDSPAVVPDEVVNGEEEEEGASDVKIVEIVEIVMDKVVDGSHVHEDDIGCAKDDLVEKQEKRDQRPVDVLVSESCAGEACASNPQSDVQILAPGKEINCEKMEENACTVHPMVESHVSCEVETEKDGDAINEPVAENQEANEDAGLDRNSREEVVEANKLASPEITEVKENDTSKEVEEIDCDIVTAKGSVIMPRNNDNNLDFDNEAEESFEETGAKQVPQQAEIILQGVEKIKEDAAPATKENANDSPEITEVKENGASKELEEIDSDIVTAKGNEIMPRNNENNPDSDNESEESSKETGAKQVPQQAKLFHQEVEFKIKEDAAPATKENANDSPIRPNGVQIQECNSKTKYAVNLAKSRGWGVVITVLSVLSSVSCSWYFGLSLVKLCAVLFLAMLLSKFHG